MDERLQRVVSNIATFENLAQFEKNADQRDALDDALREAIKRRSAELGHAMIAQRTGLTLADLSPAEEKIVQAVSEYVGVMKREGKDATRTLTQLRNRGFIDAAEVAVAKSKPTQGFQALVAANLGDLSYEQIIVDHPDEFSPRALWYARRTLGLKNDSEKPPAKAITPIQIRTEKLLLWLQARSETANGIAPHHRNDEAAAALGLGEMHKFGRVFGNIQSRIDFACYLAGLPPLGLVASEPFAMAWSQQDRTWAFPVGQMQAAARSRIWTAADFSTLLKETEKLPGLAYVSWQKELDENPERVRRWAFGLSAVATGSTKDSLGEEGIKPRNPPWSRDELILALDLYLRFPEAPPGKNSPEVDELSAFLTQMGRNVLRTNVETFRNVNSVYMKMMNFRRFDPQYTAGGNVGLTRGNKEEETVWNEFANDPARLATTVMQIRNGIKSGTPAGPSSAVNETPYWVFVCNPKKWAIDRFFDRGIERDTWGIRPSDRARFAPGQLGIVRVGVDQRSEGDRDGKPPLKAGIYALCEVESETFDGTGAASEFWAEGAGRGPGWPTVRIRYLRTYLANPLTIERMRAEKPSLSRMLLNGFQAASFPITADDFHAVLALLGEDVDNVPWGPEGDGSAADQLADLEKKYLKASPEIKVRLSKTIERGPIGSLVKKATGFRCQLCEALGSNPTGFLKKNGEPYVEAHHVMPVSSKEVGSLSATNVMTVCANHHRELHYGNIGVTIKETTFEFNVSDTPVVIPRLKIKPYSR